MNGFPDPASAFSQGLTQGRQTSMLMKQQQMEADKMEYLKLQNELQQKQQLKQERSQRLEKQLDFDVKTKNLKGARETLAELDKINGTNMAMRIPEEKIAEFNARMKEIDKAEPSMQIELMQRVISQYPVLSYLGGVEERQKGLLPKAGGPTTKAFAPVTLINPQTREKRLVIPTYDPVSGKAILQGADIPAGFEVSQETPEEKRQADVLVSREKEFEKVTGKGIAGREQKAIDRGLDMAEGYAVLKRGKDLLDQVKTGGFNAVSLRAKQMLGIESADEAELSNKLGKAVLSQLRETFGAAFTENEGKRLSNIEAEIGKSTEGNKRLLNQAMQIVERAARRGIRAAKRAGDLDSVAEIEDLLKFTLEPEESQPAPMGQPVQASQGKFKIISVQ